MLHLAILQNLSSSSSAFLQNFGNLIQKENPRQRAPRSLSLVMQDQAKPANARGAPGRGIRERDNALTAMHAP